MNEEPHLLTLKVIRRITADSVLEMEEVMDLARFLNDNRAARHAWPGSVLWKTLESVFEDGEVTDEELVAIGSILQDIEMECAGVGGEEELTAKKSKKPPRVEPAVHSAKAEPFEIPASVSGVSMQTEGGQLYMVNLTGPECECEEWRDKRSRLSPLHPGRICRHVAGALRERLDTDEGLSWPPLFRGMVKELAEVFRGTVTDAEWKRLRLDDREYLLALTVRDWVHVYGPDAEQQFERFSYRRKDHRWFFGAKPLNAPLIASYIDSLDAGS